jgi:transcriptional regulator with XRE-family HTH domain
MKVFFPLSDKQIKDKGIVDRFSVTEGAVFPQILRELRTQKHVTLTTVANEIGITHSTLGLYEKGNTVPDIKTIVRLAEYYGVTVNYLLGVDERPTFETEYISKNTGLSQDVIEMLLDMRTKSMETLYKPDGIELTALNKLLSSKDIHSFLQTLFYLLYEKPSDLNVVIQGESRICALRDITLESKPGLKASTPPGILIEDLPDAIKTVRLNKLRNLLSELQDQTSQERVFQESDPESEARFQQEISLMRKEATERFK